MGAEGSKSNGTKGSGPPGWISPEELQIVNKRVQELAFGNDMNQQKGSALKVKHQILKTRVSSLAGPEVGDRFCQLITQWRKNKNATVADLENIACGELSALLLDLLNPDPAVQAQVLLLLASGSNDGEMGCQDLLEIIGLMIDCYCRLPVVVKTLPKALVEDSAKHTDEGHSRIVALAWLHDLFYNGESHKKTVGKALPDSRLTQSAVERWLRGHSGLYFVVHMTVLRSLAAPELPMPERLLPEMAVPRLLPMNLVPSQLLMLNTALPKLLRCKWRLLFSNYVHGDSFSSLMKQIVNAGPSVVLVEDSQGNMFGGFASSSWQVRPQFHGTAESFLFQLKPVAGIYCTTGYNSNYQYLNYLEKNTMPNGLGMGGIEQLFGFFVSYEFGECRVAPSCTTFHSPPLCPSLTPQIKHLCVWGVGEEPKDSDDEDDEEGGVKKRSALDRNPDARAMLDMMGRERVSEGFREPDSDSD